MNSIKCSPGAGIASPVRSAAKPSALRPNMLARMPVRANAAALNYSASDAPRAVVSQGAAPPVAGAQYSPEQLAFMDRQKQERAASVSAGRVGSSGSAPSYTAPGGARLNYSPSDPPRAEVPQGAAPPVAGAQYSPEQLDFMNRQKGERAASVAAGRVSPPRNAGYAAPAAAAYSAPAPAPSYSAPAGARLNYSPSDAPRAVVSQGAAPPVPGAQYSREQLAFMDRQNQERAASVSAGRVGTGGPAPSYTAPGGARLNYSPSDPPRAEVPQGAQAPISGGQYSREQLDFMNRQKGERAASVAAGRVSPPRNAGYAAPAAAAYSAPAPSYSAPAAPATAGLSADQIAFMQRMADERAGRSGSPAARQAPQQAAPQQSYSAPAAAPSGGLSDGQAAFMARMAKEKAERLAKANVYA
eukprot:gene20393-27165_t